ncbi:MAG: transposase [bacterium]|nr:transposase [bacterium]
MRQVVLAPGEIYHVFNRSIEQRPVFTNKREYKRALQAFDYYRFKSPPLRLSKAMLLETKLREDFFQSFKKEGEKLVDIIAYCFMPNHFHFLLKQKEENGISRFTSNFTNSYTRYYNTKYKRIGALFQGIFKAVHVGNDEQLIHVSRYIHLNPVVSFLVQPDMLDSYLWSSFQEFIGKSQDNFCATEIILDNFSSSNEYREFVNDRIDYGRKLELIKHLILE